MKLALVGATGLVGSQMIRVLEEKNVEVSDFIPAASESSIGKKIFFRGKEYQIVSIANAIDQKPDAVLFSAGAEVSGKYAPDFAKNHTYVIDNSSAWRMDKSKKLVVPEVNAQVLTKDDYIIANPNCSTIQLVVALNPLHLKFGIKRIVVSTYQAVSGTGMRGVMQMENERKGIKSDMIYPHPIDKNCFPHGGSFLEDGETSEEVKLVNETRKIIGDDSIEVTATVVRIPVYTSHSESVNVEFHKPFEVAELRELLSNSPGIKVLDDPSKNIYPTPLMAEGKDDVFVGRIRRDKTLANGLNLWIVSDNLRKGAATNAVQILEYLMLKGIVAG